MSTALPDIAISETLLERADAKAREMNVSRNRLVEIALEKLLAAPVGSVVERAVGAWAADRLAREAQGDFRSGAEILLEERRAESEARDLRLFGDFAETNTIQ